MSLGQLRELTPRGIAIAMRQTLRWARAAEQDLDPFIKGLHANYAVGNLDQLRQLASDREIIAATGQDPAVLALRFARLQDEAAAAIGLEGRTGMTVPLSRRGEALGQGLLLTTTVTDPATGKLVEVDANQPFLLSGEPNRIIRLHPIRPPVTLPAFPVVPPVLEPERTVKEAPAEPSPRFPGLPFEPPFVSEPVPPGVFAADIRLLPRAEPFMPGGPIRIIPRGVPPSPPFVTRPAERPGILRRRTEAPARFTPEEAPPGILFRFFGGARPGVKAAAAEQRGVLFPFLQRLFPPGRRQALPAPRGPVRQATSSPTPVRALGQGEFFGFPIEEAEAAPPAVPVPTAEILREPAPRVVASRGSTGPTVRRIQELLRALALPAGRVDGVYGPLTEQAVRLFQQEEGLPVTGAVDDFTLAALEAAVAQAGPPARTPGTTPSETRQRTFPLPGQAGPPILFGLRAEQLAGVAFLVAVLGIAVGGGPPRGRGGVPRSGTIEVVSNHDQQTYVRAAAEGDLVLVRRLLAKYPEVPRREWAKLTPLPPGL